KSVSYPTIIKPNTKYTVDLKRNDKPLTVNLGGTEVTFVDGETRKTITTPSTLTNDKLSYYGVGAKCNEIMLIEGEIERNVDYFTGMQSVVMQNQMPILITTGKNLFDEDNAINGYFIANTGVLSSGDENWKYQYIKANPNTTYTISGISSINTSIGACQFDKNKNFINTAKAYANGSFTTDAGTEYIGVSVRVAETNAFQIEQGSTATSYEPYKSSILSLPEEVVLRSLPSGVCDTFNIKTGVYTQRIGEIVLEGESVQFLTDPISNDGLYQSYYTKNNFIENIKASSHTLSDKLPTKHPFSWQTPNMECVGSNFNGLNISLKLSTLNVTSEDSGNTKLEKLYSYLQLNPIIVQYELANPIIETVDLNVIDQDGNIIPKIKSYNDITHLEITVPKQSLLPHISAEVATDNSKDMSSLTTKHQEISETQSVIEDNIQSQSDEIDTALMATTEIFESILE
ncbi:MAG: hypothetical protein PUK09_01595, partial [Bacilli bacterium]|nr:hypothetical protein [Bacilli bacterium]